MAPEIKTLFAALLMSVTAVNFAVADNDPDDDVGGGHADEIAGQAIVRRAPGYNIQQVREVLQQSVDHIQLKSIDGAGTYLLRYILEEGQAPQSVQVALDGMIASGMILFGEANFTSRVADGQTGSLWVTDISQAPAIFANQFALGLLQVSQAHTLSNGGGVTVAVLDSGLDETHPTVAGVIAPGAWDFVQNDANTEDTADGVDNDNDGQIDEGFGHGTFCTSLIRLVAPEARILPIRVLNDDGGSDAFTIALGIHHAIDKGADVINISVGTLVDSQAVADACLRAKQNGVIVMAAMGNLNGITPLTYPAAYSTVYGVVSSDCMDLRAPDSSFGASADLSSPGHTPVGLDGSVNPSHGVIGAIPGSDYAYWGGTSFATAFATGTATLVRAQYPEWPNATVPAGMVADEIMGIVSISSDPIDALNPGFEGMLGSGRVNAYEAVLLGPPAPVLGDLDGNRRVDGADLVMILSSWGPCQGCSEDISLDGMVDGADMVLLMANWSPL